MRYYRVYGKTFDSIETAVRYMELLKVSNALQSARLDYLDAAVEKSDCSEAKEVIKYIMEKQSEK